MGGELIAVGGEKETRKIVVGVDESEESMYALSWCLNNIVLRHPQNYQDTLVILHVKRPTLVYPGFDKSAINVIFSCHDATTTKGHCMAKQLTILAKIFYPMMHCRLWIDETGRWHVGYYKRLRSFAWIIILRWMEELKKEIQDM
ncbi:Universal stress protein PHOS34 [Bienertia sinuspersici]